MPIHSPDENIIKLNKRIQYFMKYLLLCLAATSAFSLCLTSNAFAGNTFFFQSAGKDTVPARLIDRVNVTVKDLMDGEGLDSVYVTVGAKRGYTNGSGSVSFDSVRAGAVITASKNGYLVQSKKAKTDVVIRLGKRETSSSSKDFNNGLYQRPFEHFSGANTVVTGAELRKINPLNFIEALKYYAPS